MNTIKKQVSSNLFLNKLFKNPFEMHIYINEITKSKSKIRNFCGVIENMDRNAILIETDLFSKEVLEFYSKHNMGLLDTTRDTEVYKKFYNEMRGGEMGDYSPFFQDKLSNVIEALLKFPSTKRGILTMPYSKYKSQDVKHDNDAEQKCLRELPFYIEEDYLHCTGYMRAHAALIFP